jgi:hypothetical protein
MKKREIPALLRPKMMDLDFSVLAEMIRQQGRGRDKILAHITPDEARLLKQRGGRGSINPATGLPEFEEEYVSGYDLPEMDTGMGAPTSFDVGPGELPSDVYAQTFPQESYAPAMSYPQAVIPPMAPQAPAYTPTPVTTGAYGGFPMPLPTTPPPAADPEQPGFFGELGRQTQEYLQKPENALRALGVAGTGLVGALQARRAGRQGEAARREIQDIGAPYRARGQELVAAGQRGELTAPQQQALQQIRAQSQQQLARAGIRGGTAAMQAEAAIQRQAEQFAQQNIDRGLQLLNIADQYTAQGIKAAYQADADARNLAQRFFAAATQQIPQSAAGAVRTTPTA